MMERLVQTYKRRPHIRETALDLIHDLPQRQWREEVASIFKFVRDRIRYTRDIAGVETLQTPDVTLELEAGDCDDKSVLLAALLESVGHPTRFVATGYKSPGAYSHVYVEARMGDKWLTLDPTVQHELGWEPRKPLARMTT